MRRMFLGALLSLAALVAVAGVSYVVLNHFYGGVSLVTTTQNITIENSGQDVTIDDVEYGVKSAELDVDNTDFYMLDLNCKSYVSDGYFPSYPASAPAGEWIGPTYQISVPRGAYETAQTTGQAVTVTNTTTTETRPIDVLPIAAGIGIAIGLAVMAVWAGYQQTWGGATSTLLEHGLRDMTVRDVEIVGCIMELEEFTIPELMKMTKASKITVWRTVQKLVEKGIVQQTEKTKLAADGLGGRGKPSSVYRYVSAKVELKKQ